MGGVGGRWVAIDLSQVLRERPCCAGSATCLYQPRRLLSEEIRDNLLMAPSMRRLVGPIALVVLLNACAGSEATLGPPVIDVVTTSSTSTSSTTLPVLPPLQGLELDLMADGLDGPVTIASAPSVGLTFVVERTGKVRSVTTDPSEVVLDISERVSWEMAEQGFLGFLPHPDFPSDARAFAIYIRI